ncbi:hypothetical protein GGI09_000336 [Coemansia sp. S100]|nr:hypothetical protein GGI09_000336 [Coemansia sp. S100]KAJ2110464.1 hypothetical protein GGI16_000289 [Coemansia sp. S142-1]
MRTFSPFQLLPPHVVQLVVNHVAGSSRLQLSGVTSNSVEYKRLLVPLMRVCCNFRAIALPLYYRDFRLHLFVRTDEVDIEECSWTTHIDNSNSTHHLLAREIVIRVYVYNICEGQALQLLSAWPYDGCAFPQARKLKCELVVCCTYAGEPEYTYPGADDNTSAFIKRIKEMSPRVSEIYLGISYKSGDSAPGSGKHMRFLVSKLSELTDTTFFTDGCDELFKSPDLVPVCKLARISFKIKNDASQILHLARLNAMTLQTMGICSCGDVDISGLIRDPDDDKYIEYPRARTLIMWFRSDSAVLQRPNFKGAVPFPNLQRLVLGSGHPFGDDVLFRGNGATLKYLSLSLTSEFVTLLTRHNVFTSTSHPKLLYVAIHLPFAFYPDELVEATACLKFGYGIVPGAPVRSIVSNSNIQYLCMPKTSPSIWDVVTLVKSLPLLSDLHTGSSGIVVLPQGITEEKLPEYLREKYAPMGERFRCWHLSSADYPMQVVISVLLLALICPYFDHAAVEYTRSQLFMEILERQIYMPRFEQYAPRLKRLLVSHKKR